MSSDKRLLLDALLVGMPAVGLLAWFVATSTESLLSRAVIAGLVLGWVMLAAYRVRNRFVYHLRTFSILVEAIRREDFSLRSSRHKDSGVLGNLFQQVNELADHLQDMEQQEQELRGLLAKVIGKIDVAILAIDHRDELCLVNPRAAQLAALPAEQLLGVSLEETVFGQFSFSDEPSLCEVEFPGAIGRWQVSWQEYRQEARPGKLLFITDLRQVLSRQEAQAWKGLIRVITHEINNSLTPISSISQTLASRLAGRDVKAGDEDFLQGLELIGQRSNDLTGFVADYARLARLPEPQMQELPLPTLLQGVASLHPGRVVFVGDDTWDGMVTADPVQLEQLFINLVKNALEASEASEEPVKIALERDEARAVVRVLDRGPGLANPSNLFIPFYSTKPKGSGIGLTLCRQIAESHGGLLTLENRDGGNGAVSTLTLPL
jgi:nitrogen fixation/metabolism regulation signal transduction histidine kinase